MLSKIVRRFSRQTGKQFKDSLRRGDPKFGYFINSSSPVVAEQMAQSRTDWLLIDAQHGPFNNNNMASMLSGIGNNQKTMSFVRVAGYNDRPTIQQALDSGAHGILLPYVKTRSEVEEGVYTCLYPEPSKHTGSRSIYFPQRSSNELGLLGYTGGNNEHVITAIQCETKECLDNIEDICQIPHLDVVFVGRNDLALSMGLFEKYQFPDMYSSPELNQALEKVINTCHANGKIPGIFLFGTEEIQTHLEKGFRLIAAGNDLHCILSTMTGNVQQIRNAVQGAGLTWDENDSNLIA